MNEVFLIGDSHTIALRKSFVASGWKVFGGGVLNGHTFESPFFEQNEGKVRFIDEHAQNLFANALREAGVSTLGDLEIPIVTTIGFASYRLAHILSGADRGMVADEAPSWSNAVMAEAVATTRRYALAFYKTLPAKLTYAVHSPQKAPEQIIPKLRYVEDVFVEMLAPLGVNIIDVRDRTTEPNGTLKSKYFTAREGDKVHANRAYGAVVVDALIAQLRANGQFRPGDAS